MKATWGIWHHEGLDYFGICVSNGDPSGVRTQSAFLKANTFNADFKNQHKVSLR